MRLILAFLSFLLPAVAAADDRTGGGDGVQVARVAVIGRELATELLRYGAGSPVFLGNEQTLPVVIIADPKRDSGDQPNPDLFRRTLPGCRPGSLVSCCFNNGGLVPPSVWYFTLYGWINSSKACRENLERTTTPTDIEPPLADAILLYSGIDNELITTAGQGDDLRVLHVHDKHHGTKLICGRVTNPCSSSPQAGQGTKCGLDAPKAGTLWAAHVCESSSSWAKLPDPCTCGK